MSDAGLPSGGNGATGAAAVAAATPAVTAPAAVPAAEQTGAAASPPVNDGATHVAPEAGAAPAIEGAQPAPDASATAQPEGGESAQPDGKEPGAAETADNTAKPEGEQKPAAPTYQPYQMPEGFEANEAQVSTYNNILGKYGISQEAGQELLNFHAQTVRDVAAAVDQRQRDTFAKTNDGWVARVHKEFGNQRDTRIAEANDVIRQFGGTKKQVAELWSVLGFTGAGNHPSTIRLLSNIKRALSERGAPPRNLPDTGKAGTPWERRYGNPRKA